MTEAKPLQDRYWFIEDNEAMPIDMPVPEFWDQLMSGQFEDNVVETVAEASGWLVTAYDMAADMQSSEMHPDGDELHYLVTGRLELVLEHEDGDEVVDLTPGVSASVPRGVWHRFIAKEPAHGLAITFGRGTQHRPLKT